MNRAPIIGIFNNLYKPVQEKIDQMADQVERRLAEMRKDRETPATEIHCPLCGYYCLGKGGMGCIDKPWLVAQEKE